MKKIEKIDRQQLELAKSKVHELYGLLCRGELGEHTRIGVLIVDTSKIKNFIWEIMEELAKV